MKQRFSTRTRLVSGLLTAAMVFTFLPFSALAEVQTYIPLYKFPDETFREYLERFDKDDDTFLSTAEREDVTEIDVSNKGITTLEGISYFPNLKKLNCAQNNLSSLDVSQNTKLQFLYCDSNQLTELDVSKNTQIETLYCFQNQLSSLDVSQNTELQVLLCGYNQLTSLQADNCTKLREIGYSGNKYSVQVYESTRVLDPGTLPGNFDISRVRNLTGATKNADGTLTVNPGVGKVTYEYRFLKDHYAPFTLNVNVVPDSTVTPPSGGDGTGTTTPPSGGGGGGAAILLVGGAAVAGLVGYGVYNYVSEQQLKALLPEGTAVPENRAQTALLLWNTAGRPEPAEAPAFADVADPDTAKAAQWCVEQGLMKRRLNGKFAPGSSIPAYQVLNAYRKLAG